jgi:hypothetical protein
VDSWGAAAPRFGAMDDYSMEIWCKADGGRDVGDHLKGVFIWIEEDRDGGREAMILFQCLAMIGPLDTAMLAREETRFADEYI